MKKIRAAYKSGYDQGHEADPQASRAVRLANCIGRASFNKQIAEENEQDAARVRLFEKAVAAAKGPNKKALEAIRAFAAIPGYDTSRPIWGADITHPDGKVTKQWNASLSSVGVGHEPEWTRRQLTRPMGDLMIDSPGWAHNALNVPAHRVSIVCEADYDKTGNLGLARTLLHINSKPYDPESPFEDHHLFTGLANVSIDESGHVSEIQLGRGNYSGLVSEPNATADVDKLLDGVIAAARGTAEDYREFQALTEPPQP
jgi:hypothetical protein